MRLLRLILISLVVLGIVVTFVFSLFPSQIRISRVININAPKEKIASVINDLKTWDDWNELTRNSKHKAYGGTSGAGEIMQSGEMRITITASTEDSIKTNWAQTGKKPFNGGFNLVEAGQGVTTVEWYFNFHFRWYPWEKLGSMFYDKQMGPLMEKSLLNLNNYITNH